MAHPSDRRHAPSVPGPGRRRTVLVSRRRPPRVLHERRRRSPLHRGSAQAQTRDPIVVDKPGLFRKRRAQPQSGLVTGWPMDLLRARTRTDRRDERVARSTIWRHAGATDGVAGSGESPGAHRRAHAALRRARGGPVGTMAMVARRRDQGDATSHLRPRALLVGVSESRRPARGGHSVEPHGQPVACAAARSTSRGSRRSTVCAAERAGAFAALRRDVAVLLVRSGCGRRPLAVPGRESRSKSGRPPNDSLSEPPAVSPDGTRVAIIVRQEGKLRLSMMSADGTNARTLAPSITIQGSGGQGSADWSPDGTWIVAAGTRCAGSGAVQDPGRWRRARAPRLRSGGQSGLVAGWRPDCVWRPRRGRPSPAPRSETGWYPGRIAGRAGPSGRRPSLPAQRNGPGVLASRSVAGFLAARSRHEEDPPAHPSQRSRQRCARSTSRPTASPSCSTARARTPISS